MLFLLSYFRKKKDISSYFVQNLSFIRADYLLLQYLLRLLQTNNGFHMSLRHGTERCLSNRWARHFVDDNVMLLLGSQRPMTAFCCGLCSPLCHVTN